MEKNQNGSLGDVKYSILPPVKFQEVNGNGWVPMDGRCFSGSGLFKLLSPDNTNLPDVSGLFIRAMDERGSIDPYFNENNKHRIAGYSLQSDAFMQHGHTMPGGNDVSGQNRMTKAENVTDQSSELDSRLIRCAKPVSSYETRPVNISFYVYIKIND